MQEKVSFRVAGSYVVTPNLIAFAGFSDSYTPQGGTTANLEPIQPLHHVSYEGGVKVRLFGGGVLWTNTIYQITQDNIAAADLNDPRFRIPFGKVRIRGFESEFVGTVSSVFDLSAGATIQ